MDSTTFDVDAWLDEAAPPTRSVTVYGRGDLVARLQDLAAAAPEALSDPRLAGSAPSAEAEALRAKIEASALTLHVRGLLDREQQALLESVTTEVDAKRTVDESRYEVLLVAAAAVYPWLSEDQVTRLRERIGQAQWDAVFAAITAASRETIDVPLSRLGSETAPDS
jgi:hypothetical protein